jgi:hypothetical protein
VKKLTRFNVYLAFGSDASTVHLKSVAHPDGQWVPSARASEIVKESDKLQADRDLQRQVHAAAMALLREIIDDNKAGVWNYNKHQDWLEKTTRYVEKYNESLPEDRMTMAMLESTQRELEQVTKHSKELVKNNELLQNQLILTKNDLKSVAEENNKLSRRVDELLTDLGRAYKEVEKWKEEYRVTEKAREDFERAAVLNMRENVQLKMNQSQAIYGEQVKSGDYLGKQSFIFKLKMLRALGRATFMTADELDSIDVFDEVTKLRNCLERVKDALKGLA